MPKKRNPGCKCCKPTSCPLFSDDFNRADSPTIGNGWTENAGTWDIVSQALRTTSANARCTNSLTSAFSLSNGVSGKMKSSASGDTLRLYSDPSNSDYVELTVGTSATIKIVIGGTTRSTCSVTAAAGAYHTVEMRNCNSLLRGAQFGGVLVYLNGTLVTFAQTISAPAAGAGNYHPGFGTGATVTGNCDFDDFAQIGYELWREQQIVAITGAPTGGTFTLTIPGYGTTSAIAWNANAAAVKTAIESVLGVTTFAPVATTGGPFPASNTVCFLGGAAAGVNVGLMTLATNSLTGGASPNVTITASVDGGSCPDCYACHPILDTTINTSGQVKLIVSGWANGSGATGVTNLNGTFFLSAIGAACSTTITNNCNDSVGLARTVFGAPCACYELAVNFTVTWTNPFFPFNVINYNITLIRAYAVNKNIDGTSNNSAKMIMVEFVDSGNTVRAGMIDRFIGKTCYGVGVESLGNPGLIYSCFQSGVANIASAAATIEHG